MIDIHKLSAHEEEKKRGNSASIFESDLIIRTENVRCDTSITVVCSLHVIVLLVTTTMLVFVLI